MTDSINVDLRIMEGCGNAVVSWTAAFKDMAKAAEAQAKAIDRLAAAVEKLTSRGPG